MSISSNEIEDLAKAPQKTRTDEGTVEERPISELIEADRHTKATTASVVPWGMRIARVKPGGTV